MENRWLLVFFSGVPLESVGVEGGVSSPTLPCISSSAVHWPGGGDNDPLVVLLVLGGVIAVDTNVIPKLLFLYGSSLLLVLACVLCVLCRLSTKLELALPLLLYFLASCSSCGSVNGPSGLEVVAFSSILSIVPRHGTICT